MRGKDKCKILKEIRAQIAAANEIEWVVENCSHKGECRGTCPKCEAEVAKLERALARRRALGKTVAVVGLSATMMVTVTSCDALSYSDPQTLDGDTVAPETTTATDPLPLPGAVPDTDELGGVPLAPPETTEDIDGEIVDMGDPVAVVFYTADFKYYENGTPYRATDSIYLYDVIEEIESDEEVWELQVGCIFKVLGETEDGSILLISYADKLYAMDQGILDAHAEPYTHIEDAQ